MAFGSKKKARTLEDAQALLWREQAGLSCQSCLLVRRSDLLPLAFSPNFKQVVGVEPQRMVDDVYALHPYIEHESLRLLKEAIRDWNHSEDLRFQFDYCPPDAQEHFPMRGRIHPTADGLHYYIELRNAAEEVAVEQAHEQQIRQIMEETQTKTDFLSRMSHEIRTPLNGIIGMLNLAHGHQNDQKQLQADLAKMNDLSQLLLNLVNDILDMSRLESGKVELEPKALDLESLAEELRGMFAGTAAERGINYTVVTEDLQDRYVLADRLRLSQIIINFVSNSMKFTESGGDVRVTLREMHRTEGSMHLLAKVHDTGKGMERSFLSRIFKPFEQENASIATSYGGTGLGLTITEGLVKLMGGEIIVDSEVGVGSDFSVYLTFPIVTKEQADQAAEKEKPIAPAPPAEDALRGLRFLMAEDNDINAMIATELLAQRGVEVIRAKDGGEVIEMFEQSEPGFFDGVLMDIQMPVRNGWEAMELIRSSSHPDAQSVIVLGLSANAFTEDIRRSKQSGADDHIAKPIDFDELARTYLIARTRRPKN